MGAGDPMAQGRRILGMQRNRQFRRPRLLIALITLAAAAGLAAVDPLRAALPKMNDIAFQVYRDGAQLGHHKISFRRENQDLHVDIDIQLEVKLLFLTVFSYSHQNREVWRDGRLVAIDTATDDDGQSYWMRGRATEQGLAIEGSSGRFLAPADVIPTSYWNSDIVKETRLLDTQHGRLIQVEIEPAGLESVPLAGQPVETRRYSMTGDLTLDLWYTAQGEWAKTSFEARGASVIYARQGESAALAEVEGPAREK